MRIQEIAVWDWKDKYNWNLLLSSLQINLIWLMPKGALVSSMINQLAYNN